MSVQPNRFVVELMDLQGHVARKVVQASSGEEARQIAASSGASVLDCTQAATSDVRVAGLRRASHNLDLVSFSQDLATLMSAGLTVKEAIATLAKRERAPARLSILEGLSATMAQGLSFSQALERARGIPKLLVATVAASEQTGDLAAGLSRYGTHQASLRAVRDKVLGACVYPVLLLTLGTLVVLVLLSVVVPRFSRLLEASDRELPAFSGLLMSWGRFADAHPVAPATLVVFVLGAAAFFAVQMMRPASRRRWLALLPGADKLAREFQHLQMYRTTAILTSRGIPVHRAFDLTSDLLNPADQHRMLDALARMREGAAMSAALAATGLSDPVAQSMLLVAERSGSTVVMLDRIADYYERSLQRNIELASRLIEPILMIAFGILVGGIVVMMYLPIFDLAASVG